MLPSAFIFKKCVEVFHLQSTFLPNFFIATDLFLLALQHCHFSGISGKEGITLTCLINHLAPDTSPPHGGVLKMNLFVESLLISYLFLQLNVLFLEVTIESCWKEERKKKESLRRKQTHETNLDNKQ